MEIRHAVPADLPAMEALYDQARAFMAAHGNPTQWGDGYPDRAMLEEDMALGRSYVCEENGQVTATLMYTAGPEPTYQIIEDGQWPDDEPYGVVHRLAAGGRGGAGTSCLNWCLAQSGRLRIDTHADNHPMRSLLDKLGFSYCGVIHVEDGTPRLAYHHAQGTKP